MQHEDIVNGWLSGADSVDGHDNPAGSLYTGGVEATEASMAGPQFGLLTLCSLCTGSSTTEHCC